MSAVLTNALVIGVDGALALCRDALRPVNDSSPSDNQQADLRRAAWMAAAQAGDRAAYERVLGESVGVIRSVARRQGVPLDLLDDVVQETLITIHRVRHTYDPSRSYHAWLAAIAARRGIDALRQHGRRDRRELHEPLAVENFADEGEASDATEHDQRAAALREAIATLPPGQREAVEHLGLRERSLAETAELTGRSTGALKVNLHRALKALRRRLHGDS
jgi:RNA polymerase sigma-70 factor (ECF subfamily)